MKFSSAFIASFALVYGASANVGAEFAAAGEEAMLRSERIERNLGTVERMVAKAMRGHSKELMEEEGLLHKAARFADEGAEFAQKAAVLREDEAVTRDELKKTLARATASSSGTSAQKAGSGLAHLVSAEGLEKQLAKNGKAELEDVSNIKGEVVEALGETDPSTAAKVEKLMDVVRKEQTKLVHTEVGAAGSMEHLAAEVKAQPVKKADKTALLSHKVQVHVSEAAMAGALSGFARSETNVANADRHTYHEMRRVDKMADSVLEAQNPAVAKQVADLLAVAEHEQGDIAMSEHMEAQREGKLAHNMLEHADHTSKHTAFSALHTSSMTRTHAEKERALVRASDRVFAETEQARAMVDHQLAGTKVGTEVEDLLLRAEGAVNEVSRDSRRELRRSAQGPDAYARLRKQLRGV